MRIKRQPDPRNPLPADFREKVDALFAAADVLFKGRVCGELVLTIVNGKATDMVLVKDETGAPRL